MRSQQKQTSETSEEITSWALVYFFENIPLNKCCSASLPLQIAPSNIFLDLLAECTSQRTKNWVSTVVLRSFSVVLYKGYSIAVILDTSLDSLLSRRRHLRYDPVEKRPYSSKYYMPVDKNVASRLLTVTRQSKTMLHHRQRNFSYEAVLIQKSSAVRSENDPCCITLDGNRPVNDVYSEGNQYFIVARLAVS